MKTAVNLLAALVLAALSASLVQANDMTYINNLSSRPIRAWIDYSIGSAGTSQFQNRLIHPGTHQSDEYIGFLGDIVVGLVVDGSPQLFVFTFLEDQSVLCLDNEHKTGVDVFPSHYGDIGAKGGPLLGTLVP